MGNVEQWRSNQYESNFYGTNNGYFVDRPGVWLSGFCAVPAFVWRKVVNTLRILHVVHQYPPDFIAGTELYTQTIARYQAKAGHDVAVFAPAPHGEAEPAVEDGVRVYRVSVGSRRGGAVFAHTFYHKGLARPFATVLAQENPEIIHVQHLMGLPFAIMRQVMQAGIPYVITLHDYWYGCANGQLITNDNGEICSGPGKTYRNCGRCAIARSGKMNLTGLAPVVAPLMAYRNGRLRHIITHAASVIAPTRFVQTIYRQMGIPGDNMVVVPHGIELPQEKIRAALEKRPLSPPHSLHIGYVGSIAPQKGIHILVEAVNQLPVENVKLTLCGSLDTFPDYAAHLKKIARHPGIHFAGRVAHEAIWNAFASFDVVTMPTLWYEASPLTIQEAFAVKTPIVASAIGAMPEKITHGVDGLLVPPGDVAALHAALLSLIEDPNLLPRLQSGIQPVYAMAEQVKEISKIYITHNVGRNKEDSGSTQSLSLPD